MQIRRLKTKQKNQFSSSDANDQILFELVMEKQEQVLSKILHEMSRGQMVEILMQMLEPLQHGQLFEALL